MKLIFYTMEPGVTPPRPAPATREWMDNTHDAFAYRCLPLNIANSHGWEILNPAAFSACWKGGSSLGEVDIRCAAPPSLQPTSIFGHGVLTFHLHGIFRTEPGWNMFACGPPNSPKDGIYPLSGVIETDWAPYTFTMNWLFTRPNHWVTFDEGEPFCFVYPVQRGVLDQITPELRSLSDDPKLKADHETWSRQRTQFSDRLSISGSQESKERWQKRYYRGLDMQDQVGAADHQAKLRLPEFVDKQTRTSTESTASSAPILPAFFRKVVKLSRTKHANLGINQDDYGFAATAHVIPLTASEMPAAAKDYPLVFSSNNPPRPLCVVGTRPGINLFVDAEGHWRPGKYIPAAVRRYPFVTIINDKDPESLIIGIDDSAAKLSPSGSKKLYENGKMSAYARERAEFSARVATAFNQTDGFAATLPHETLLMPVRNVAPHRIAGQSSMFGLRVIDPERLAALPESVKFTWQASRWLASLLAQIESAKNWGPLVALEDAYFASMSEGP